MLVPQQVNINCDICCNISASIPRTNSSCSLFTIKEEDQNTIITCYHCHGEMASIPHSMQMVKSQRKRFNHASGNTTNISGHIDSVEMDKPYRYSIKMMNAIWGMYNKDSVHNFKSMACDAVTADEIQAAAQQGVYRGQLGDLGRAVCQNFMENIYQYY